MVSWYLSKQGIRWPVSQDHNNIIADSSLELIEVSRFFFKLSPDQVMGFDRITGSSQV